MSVLTPKRIYVEELLDSGSGSETEIAGSLADLRLINRILGAAGILSRTIGKLLDGNGSNHHLSLLDVGAGSADLPTAVARWSSARGIESEIVALDMSAQNLVLGRTFGVDPKIEFVAGNGLQLPFPDRSFDFVSASHFLHHFREDEASRVLGEFARVARRGVIIVDLVRGLLPYYLVRAGTYLFAKSAITQFDAPASVLRGWTIGELEEVASKAGFHDFKVQRALPFRLLLIGIPTA